MRPTTPAALLEQRRGKPVLDSPPAPPAPPLRTCSMVPQAQTPPEEEGPWTGPYQPDQAPRPSGPAVGADAGGGAESGGGARGGGGKSGGGGANMPAAGTPSGTAMLLVRLLCSELLTAGRQE